jgi:hypothetical protein
MTHYTMGSDVVARFGGQGLGLYRGYRECQGTEHGMEPLSKRIRREDSAR